MMADTVLEEIHERATRLDADKWRRWLAAGYKLYVQDCCQYKHADALLQKAVTVNGTRLFFINAWVYLWDGRSGEEQRRLSFMPEVQFSGTPVFEVTLCEQWEPAQVEAFFCTMYDRMKCEPYDD